MSPGSILTSVLLRYLYCAELPCDRNCYDGVGQTKYTVVNRDTGELYDVREIDTSMPYRYSVLPHNMRVPSKARQLLGINERPTHVPPKAAKVSYRSVYDAICVDGSGVTCPLKILVNFQSVQSRSGFVLAHSNSRRYVTDGWVSAGGTSVRRSTLVEEGCSDMDQRGAVDENTASEFHTTCRCPGCGSEVYFATA